MKIEAFSKTYHGVRVLDFPGMELEPGRIYAVIGANGSGKSTFARILAGIIKADRKGPLLDTGSVLYMPQKPYAFRMSTQANILMGSKEYKLANRLMDDLRIDHLALRRADRLSGGETARMALARLMMRSCELAILDEPTAAMDMESTLLAEKLIRDYVRGKNCALILVTHSLRQARRLADRILFFHRGRLLETGPLHTVLCEPATDEMKAFLEFFGS